MEQELSPYLLGPYAPVDHESSGEALPVVGRVPEDLEGLLVRNGPNPRFTPPGRYHWFDGDGMLHAVRFSGGRAHYQSRWVRTAGLAREEAAGRALWGGVMEPTKHNPPEAPYKDTANTDVLAVGKELWALWYMTGTPIRVDPRTLESVGPATDGAAPLRAAAHAKVHAASGELSFFDFGFRAPFMRYGVLKDGVVHTQPIELPGPRLPHDLAVTERYAIVMDLPVVYDQAALAQRRWVTRFDRELPARFGVLPRHGGAVRWFEAEPCYIYHVVNAWEEEGAIVMIACRVEDPIPAPRAEDGQWAQMLANLRVRARLYRWRFDLETGRTREEPIDDLNTEFPSMALAYRGRPSRYSYHVHLADTRTLLFDGLVKYDLQTGHPTSLAFGPGEHGSEAPFAPRVNAAAEDDGYVLSMVHDTGSGRSELWIIDAQRFAAGPVARLSLPARVPLGFHATYVHGAVGAGT